MKAGQTNIEVGTHIRIKGVTGEDSDLNELTGRVTHPFAFGCTQKGWIGIYLDDENSGFLDNKVNIRETELQVIEE